MEKIIEKFNKIFLFFILYSIIFITFFKSLPYILPFVLALIFALILKTPTKYLVDKLNFNRTLAALITTLTFFATVTTLLLLIITSFASELIDLTKTISSYIATKSQNSFEIFDVIKKYYNNLDPTILNSIQNSLYDTLSKFADTSFSIVSSILNHLLGLVTSIPYLAMVIIFTLISTYFFTKDMSFKNSNSIIDRYAPVNVSKLSYIFSESRKMLLNYALSYLLIIFITFIVTLIGFIILGVDYSLVLSILCAILDLLPVLGMPLVYIPLVIIYIASGNYFTGIGLIILYVLVFVIRQITEPRIVSSSLGLHPVAVLAAIFVGLQMNGLMGMLFCMFLIVFYNILKKVKVL